MLGRNKTHGLRPAEPRYAGDKTRRADFIAEQKPGGIVGFGNAMQRQAPWKVQEMRREKSYVGPGICKMIVEVTDLLTVKLSCKNDAFDEIKQAPHQRAATRDAVTQRQCQRLEIGARPRHESCRMIGDDFEG